MRLSLSKKEVAEIHLMLTTLPIPPIPITIDMDVTKLEDGELKTAFEMATSSIVKDSQQQDGIVNAHSVFAALSFFVKWTSPPTPEGAARQTDMQHKKDASLLSIIASILDFNEREHSDANVATRDDDILQVFVKASQQWINTYLPDTITIAIKAAPQNKTIGYEHDMHIAMAHYCYAQGVLYNSKDSRLLCTVHDGLYNDYLKTVKQAAEDVDVNTQEKPEDTREHIEIAKMYSQFPYHKMLLLCYDRLLKDCLYGHTLQVPGNDVEQNARDLLKVSFENYKSIVNKSATTVDDATVVPSTCTSSCVPTARILELPPDVTTAPTPPAVCTTNIPRVLAVGKTGCMADMGSYKSSMGMFVLGIVNFLVNNDAYSVSNMRTSLRHLQELAYTGSDKAKQACSLINMPALVQLVRNHMHGIECGRDMKEEIEMSLIQLETLVPLTETVALDELPLAVVPNTLDTVDTAVADIAVAVDGIVNAVAVAAIDVAAIINTIDAIDTTDDTGIVDATDATVTTDTIVTTDPTVSTDSTDTDSTNSTVTTENIDNIGTTVTTDTAVTAISTDTTVTTDTVVTADNTIITITTVAADTTVTANTTVTTVTIDTTDTTKVAVHVDPTANDPDAHV